MSGGDPWTHTVESLWDGRRSPRLKVPYDFNVYGGTWKKFAGTPGTNEVGTCEKCQQPCGHNFTRWGDINGPKPIETYVRYTISCNNRVVAQDIESAEHAQLMGLAPRMAQLLQAISESDPMAHDDDWSSCRYCSAAPDEYPGQAEFVPHDQTCLWRRTKELFADLAKKPHVWGVHDMTIAGLEDAADAPSTKGPE